VPLGTILIVEDDASIRRGLCDALRASGYAVREAADGQAGLDAALSAGSPANPGLDLVLLDVLMPRLNGLSMLRELRRARPALPAIVLTARGEEEDRVRGLRLGADDYIVKPFSIAELLARIEAVLRRSPGRPTGLATITISGVAIDFDRREVAHADGTREALSTRESEVLGYLAANRGRAVSREDLLQHVWGMDPRGVATRTVDMAIARLRTILRDDSSESHGGRIILTVRGKGYMLAGESGPERENHRS
jgi:DNA-binding response OmpR family regulator